MTRDSQRMTLDELIDDIEEHIGMTLDELIDDIEEHIDKSPSKTDHDQ